jgi:tetratricopeptide (TPR) repeat protein
MWPTFFVIDPAADRVVGVWPGSASLGEMRAFVEESLATLDAMRAGTLAADDPVRLAAEARAAHAAGDPKAAAALFERAVGRLSAGHARRSEVLSGWLFALYAAKDWSGCAAVGERHVAEVRGAAVPADFASLALTCAERLPESEKALKERARAAAIARLREVTASPPADASADDRADAWGTLAEALAETGDAAGARRALEKKLAILEKAAAEARAPEVAATFDYARAMTYVELGRGGFAIAMLEGRERDMPGSYEPPARLASVLFKVGRYADAKAAVERAIAKAYGPRKLGYLRLRAQILGKMGDREGAIATLRDEVRGYEALPAGQASPAALSDAKKRLAEAESAAK